MKSTHYTLLALIASAGFSEVYAQAHVQESSRSRFDETQPYLLDGLGDSVVDTVTSPSEFAGTSFTLGGGYLNLSQELGGFDVDVDVLYVSIGSEIPTILSPNIFLATEFRLGAGIDEGPANDNFNGNFNGVDGAVDVDVDFLASLTIKLQYHLDRFYVSTGIAFTYVDYEASNIFRSVSGSEFEVGLTVGAGVNLTESLAVEFNSEFYNGDSSLSGGFKVKF
ncbi:hypothetical protein OAI07_01115 [Akkermansiaceae bacterium]|nr:hypothetical protein [Akkermansiaceae bacterium]